MPIIAARVTMKGCTLSRAMTSPLSAPTAPQARTAMAMAAAICSAGAPAGPAMRQRRRHQRGGKRQTLPTLRSMPPVRMTNVMPREMIPIRETCRRMSVRLPSWKKMREPSDAVGLTIAANRTRTRSAIRLGTRKQSGRASRPILSAHGDRFADIPIPVLLYRYSILQPARLVNRRALAGSGILRIAPAGRTDNQPGRQEDLPGRRRLSGRHVSEQETCRLFSHRGRALIDRRKRHAEHIAIMHVGGPDHGNVLWDGKTGFQNGTHGAGGNRIVEAENAVRPTLAPPIVVSSPDSRWHHRDRPAAPVRWRPFPAPDDSRATGPRRWKAPAPSDARFADSPDPPDGGWRQNRYLHLRVPT